MLGAYIMRHYPFLVTTIIGIVCMTMPLDSVAQERVVPYKGYTGTVHHFGLIAGAFNTQNPNYATYGGKRTFHDYGIGVLYDLHDYVTSQFTLELISSLNLITADYLETAETNHDKQKLVLPVDCRAYIGPSEDFQVYIGCGLQWNILSNSKYMNNSDILFHDTKAIHQLSGNAVAGVSILGPQKYWLHFNVGMKFHYSIAGSTPQKGNYGIDMSKDRGCVSLTSGVTIDLDKRKRASLMLNYEKLLGGGIYGEDTGGFFDNTQTFSSALVFHIGGTR